ncbi:MAG: glycosyltransferase family 4 protein [Candidatus Woesearchaeota archaeon]
MKIAVLCRYFPKDAIGGGEIYLYEVWKRAKKDFDTHLISGWKRDKSLLPKNTYALDLSSGNILSNYWKFYSGSKRYLGKIKPDVIHSTCYEFPSLGIPTVITVCHLGHLFGRVGKSLKLKLQRWLTSRRLKKADRIIAISKSTFNDLLKLGVDRKKIRLAYPGISTNVFKPKKTKNEKFTIVYPSRISREKAQHVAIEALRLLPQGIRKKARLQLVGFVNDEAYLNELRNLAAGLPVEILTNVERIEDYVRNSDLVVFPTMMWEGFGIVAGEALAAEKPLIATGYPAVKEVMGKHGMAIKPGDVGALASGIERLYRSSKERNKLTKGSREWIIKKFSWDSCYKVHKKVFEELSS